MKTPFLPSCPPFGECVVFHNDSHIEVITQSNVLSALLTIAAELVDTLADEVEQVGLTVWKFTYSPNEWAKLCANLALIYAPVTVRKRESSSKRVALRVVKPWRALLTVPVNADTFAEALYLAERYANSLKSDRGLIVGHVERVWLPHEEPTT